MKQVVTAQVEIKIVVDEKEQVDVKEFREFLETAVVVNYIESFESVDIKIEDVRLAAEMHLYSVPIEWRSKDIVRVWAASAAEAADLACEQDLSGGECLEVILNEEDIRKLN